MRFRQEGQAGELLSGNFKVVHPEFKCNHGRLLVAYSVEKLR